MRIVGVVAEYNPFHTGHKWQLAELRRRFGADTAVVCAMSGNFVQRGDFAVVRKHTRAEAAVRGGVDLVLELPLFWAISSAEGFARGGAEILSHTGVVDTLAFGSECADTEKLVRVADCLLSDGFASALQEELLSGDSFAAARSRAAERFCGKDAVALGTPNDILGVEYCKALQRLGGDIVPLALPRAGAAHDGAAAEGFASASHIRDCILGKDALDDSELSRYLTPDMLRLYEAERDALRAPVRMETLERAILAKLRAMPEDEFAAYDEGGEGLYHRFFDAMRVATSLDALLDAVKTKRYAYARLRRMLLAAFLDAPPSERPERVPYLRVLAMNDKGKCLLHEMRKKATLPVLIKPADVRELPAEARWLMEREARADDLYALAYPDLAQSACGGEWTTGPVIVDGANG